MERLGFKPSIIMERYKRNIQIEGFGEEGQEKLKKAKVLVVGAGGLGSPVLSYLTAAGIGVIGIVDHDMVSISNLQRQILHNTLDVGSPKTVSAKKKLEALNPEIKIYLYDIFLDDDNAAEIIKEYDFVVDCCDNYETKFLINDICVSEGKPYSHGAVLGLHGEAMTYVPGSADYRCVFEAPPEVGGSAAPSRVGILGPIAGVIGSIQATEVIKYLTGVGEMLVNKILVFDGSTMGFTVLKVNTK